MTIGSMTIGHMAGEHLGRLGLARVALGVLMLGGALSATGSARAREACPDAGTEIVALAAVEARLELRLADGRVLRLVGLDPALSTPNEPDRDEVSRAAFAGLLSNTALAIRVLAAAPDRWGRFPALAFSAAMTSATAKTAAAPEAAPTAGGLATAAIAAGLGRYLAEPAAHDCRATLVAAEDGARARRLGLWADPYYAVLAADDQAGFAERAGTMVIAEGRLASVTTAPYRATLVLGTQVTGDASSGHRSSHGGAMLCAVIAPRVMKVFEAHGVHVSSLIGRRLRLRGLLDTRFGPQIELAGPDDLDVLAPETEAAPAIASGPK